jgi:hypothetical protein
VERPLVRPATGATAVSCVADENRIRVDDFGRRINHNSNRDARIGRSENAQKLRFLEKTPGNSQSPWRLMALR